VLDRWRGNEVSSETLYNRLFQLQDEGRAFLGSCEGTCRGLFRFKRITPRLISGLGTETRTSANLVPTVRLALTLQANIGGDVMKLRIGVLLLLGVFLVSDVNSQTKEPARPDFGGDGIFSYVPPKGWAVISVPGTPLKYKAAFGEQVRGYTPNIALMSQEYTKSLDEYVTESLNQLKANMEGFAFLGKSDFQTSDGVRGIKLVTEYDDTSGNSKDRLRQIWYIFKSGPKALATICSRGAGDDKAVDQAFDAAMKTLRFTITSEERKPLAQDRESKQAAGWKQYSNDKVGLSFNYPSRCELYDKKEKLPEKFRKVWRDNTLLICLDLKPPIINFNVGIGKVAIPASSSFALYWDSVFDAISQQKDVKRLSFRSLTVSGRDAAEMVCVDKSDLKMKMVALAGYNDTFFILQFGAPSKEFDSLDKDVFTPWVDGVKVFSPRQEKVQSQDNRQVWEHTDRLFKDQGNRSWIETDRQGKVLYTFTEIDRTGDFIEIQDSSRGYTVRLYGNAMYIKGGNKSGLAKFAEFTKFYDGKWSEVASGQGKGQHPLLKKAEQGDALAQVDLGLDYERGKGVPQDYDEAVKWFRKSADQGHPQGQYKLARMYERGKGVERDYQKARELYRKAADQGYAPAQVSLGYMYEKAEGVPRDYVEAVKWYRKAAEQGNALGQNNLGVMYRKGQGVAQDHVEAVKWYRKSAEQGNSFGQANLGSAYFKGQGVQRDHSKAVELLQKAAAQNNPAAQNHLGNMCKSGEGLAKDTKEAANWYRKSAEQGYATAQYNLGWMYHHGVGVDENRQEAVKWYRKAAEQGNEQAKKSLKVME